MFKNYSFLILISFVLLISSCAGEKTDSIEIDENTPTKTLAPDPTYGMRVVDLSDHELNINLFIPEKFYDDEDGLPRFVAPSVKHNLGEARWEITLAGDKRWHLVIEELGEDTNGVEAEIERLKDVEFFDYNFESKTDSSILFNRLLKADKTTLDTNSLAQSSSYHFYCNRKINGFNLVFKNYELKDFRKLTVKKMLTSALYSY
mgnify:CR=1 FL=1|tara:strand:+ start:4064 stop:4675 length:612 start_codon:yes stop_codon:yes gene_type:complete